jgi:hypothetical protein
MAMSRVLTGPNGEPFGYPSLSDELLEQQLIPITPSPQFARRGIVPTTQWVLNFDDTTLPSNTETAPPVDERWGFYNLQIGPEVWNITEFHTTAFQDAVLDTTAAFQAYRAPEPTFIDEVYPQ